MEEFRVLRQEIDDFLEKNDEEALSARARNLIKFMQEMIDSCEKNEVNSATVETVTFARDIAFKMMDDLFRTKSDDSVSQLSTILEHTNSFLKTFEKYSAEEKEVLIKKRKEIIKEFREFLKKLDENQQKLKDIKERSSENEEYAEEDEKAAEKLEKEAEKLNVAAAQIEKEARAWQKKWDTAAKIEFGFKIARLVVDLAGIGLSAYSIYNQSRLMSASPSPNPSSPPSNPTPTDPIEPAGPQSTNPFLQSINWGRTAFQSSSSSTATISPVRTFAPSGGAAAAPTTGISAAIGNSITATTLPLFFHHFASHSDGVLSSAEGRRIRQEGEEIASLFNYAADLNKEAGRLFGEAKEKRSSAKQYWEKQKYYLQEEEKYLREMKKILSEKGDKFDSILFNPWNYDISQINKNLLPDFYKELFNIFEKYRATIERNSDSMDRSKINSELLKIMDKYAPKQTSKKIIKFEQKQFEQSKIIFNYNKKIDEQMSVASNNANAKLNVGSNQTATVVLIGTSNPREPSYNPKIFKEAKKTISAGKARQYTPQEIESREQRLKYFAVQKEKEEINEKLEKVLTRHVNNPAEEGEVAFSVNSERVREQRSAFLSHLEEKNSVSSSVSSSRKG